MTAFEVVALIGALAGASMVLGGIWLVAKGVITLAATSKADAITIEWKKQFRVNTQVPGLAFFLVGLMFISISLGFLRPPDVAPIEFAGQIKGVDQPVSIDVRPERWQLMSGTSGQVAGMIYPDMSVLVLVVSAPGYEPYTQSVRIAASGHRVAQLGTLEMRRKVVQADLQTQVAALPFTEPALGVSPTFGVPK